MSQENQERIVTQIPYDIEGWTKEDMESIGFVFLGPAGRTLFQQVVLPDGWDTTDLGCDTYLIDSNGRKRAHIYEGSTHYDTFAKMHVRQRFSIDFDVEDREPHAQGVRFLPGVTSEREPNEHFMGIGDAGKILLIVAKRRRGEYEEAYDKCENWLNANLPNWRDPLAYWDVDVNEHLPYTSPGI